MKPTRSIFEPLTQAETSVLRGYADAQPVNADADPAVLESLRERGYLLKTKNGTLVVTPEGLAALLDG